jgi:AraC-like DNA-binding protein
LKEPYDNIREFDRGFRANAYKLGEYENFIAMLKQKCKDKDVFLFKDAFEANYTVIKLPKEIFEEEEFTCLIIGPFLDHHLSQEELETISMNLKVPVIFQSDLKEYYYNTKVIESPKEYYSFIEVILSFLFGKENCKVLLDEGKTNNPFRILENDTSQDKIFPNMKLLEQFQKTEDEFLAFVDKADTEQALALYKQLCTYPFGNSIPNPLRRAKNKALNSNTLLKKTAILAEVHPGFTEPTAASFVCEIENADSETTIKTIQTKMVETYCTMIRNHSLRDYPIYLKDIINYIDFNFTENLSLRTLSEKFSINPSYLSMIFKKKTTKTLTEYINDKRIKHSMRLLETTSLPINTIARETGFEDVNYFTRLFKKNNGIAPRTFRSVSLKNKPILA